jgi:hypothetical protein
MKKLKWFDREDIDAAEFVDNSEEILTKLRALEKMIQGDISFDEFMEEVK